MDPIELLKKDHQKVAKLFQRFNGGAGLSGIVNRFTGNVSERQRRTAAEQICKELDLHTMIEEEIFYPAVRSLGDENLNQMLREAYQEHGTVKQEVARMRRAIGNDPDLQTKMNELQRNVDHHVREEENEMFPRVQELMDEGRRAELGREMQSRKRSASVPAGGSQRASRAGKTASTSRGRRGRAAQTGRGGRAKTTKSKARKRSTAGGGGSRARGRRR